MANYAWCTDIHLDHLRNEDEIVKFAETLIEKDPTGIFITGDISEAYDIVYHLSILERVTQRPIYFVLGNHDYYQGDIASVRKSMNEMMNMSSFLVYMSQRPYVVLSPKTALVGHDCWYDAQHGTPIPSRFLMSDWFLIKDFVKFSGGKSFIYMNRDVADAKGLIQHARSLAQEGVNHIASGIKAAAVRHENIVILTHYPPFKESHIFEEKLGDEISQPWFTNKLLGDTLLSAAKTYPNVNFTVLAGHTHGEYEGNPLPNLTVQVGAAEYGKPKLSKLIEIK